ncbi:MAG: TonB-dependent receptor [Candidatus Eremiobacteraeota bacterium]|nr:TonB-dependent receptor [Candidatus Eremiobacteraeota bacterium]
MKRFRTMALIVIASLASLPGIGSAAEGSRITARVLDTQGGLPVPNATVELDRAGAGRVGTAQTDANGTATFASEPPGTYVVLIRAVGYQTARVSPDLIVTPGVPEIAFQVGISRATGLKTIGYVTTVGRLSLQTTSTINTTVDTSRMQSEGFQRLGDVLTTVPGVTTSTSSSVGDDMSLSIRGFDSTETSTLLDGHPIGPVGAFGNGYNYNVSPFWGLSAANVVFGSGAAGLFGATTIAGAVNFQTVSPTRDTHLSLTQGVGTNDKLMTGFLGTGYLGNLGYAFAWGVQGTTGNFPGGLITQDALLQASATHFNCADPAHPSSKACQNTLLSAAPDLTAANIRNTVNSYWVTGQYSQYNFVGKLTYDFPTKTHVALTAYSANDWSNSTGEGDNDYQTYPYVLYGAQQTIAGLTKGVDPIYVNGKLRQCHNSIAVLVDGPNGYTCMTAQQYAVNFYGPFGGSVDRWRTLGNQDYDARVQQQLGAGTITLEGFADAYNNNLQKGPGVPLGTATSYGPGPYYLYLYKNRGYLLSDDFAMSKNDFGFGYSWLRQSNTNGAFPYTTVTGNSYNVFGNNPPLYLATASYFIRDTWTPNDKLSIFGNFWLQRSYDTSTTYFDPRISVVFRPTPSDVVRVTTGKSYSEPDPGLIALAPPIYGAPSSVNCPPTTSGTGSLTSIASVADPNLKPETATDQEIAYGHRFNAFTNIQADVYQSWENQALLGGLVPINQIQQVTVPQSLIDQYLSRLDKCPGLNPTANSLAFSTTYNAAGARYRGIVLSTNVGVARNVQFNASYNIQSAAYSGVPQDILINNQGLIDGGQIYGIPLRQGTAGLAYQNQTGFGARIDANYIGSYNSWNRNPFWFSNASISQSSPDGKTTVTLGINNLFNSAAQQYGLIGYGVFRPQNFYGSAAQGGPVSALQQGSEQYGLPFRQYFLTVKVGI